MLLLVLVRSYAKFVLLFSLFDYFFFNIFFASKTIRYLKTRYKKILDENDISYFDNPLIENSKENCSQYSNFTKEEIKIIQELKLMRIKCYIYPMVTIIIWIFALSYRIIDLAILWRFDQIVEGKTAEDLNEEERMYFEKYPSLKFIVQIFLIIYTFVSATRGIFYGASFFAFEDKLIFNIFRKMCLKKKNTNEIEPKSIVSDSSRISEKNETKNLEDNEEEKDVMEENNGNENIELNMN